MSEKIPQEIAAAVLKIGKVEWGAVGPKSDEDHVKGFVETLRITREHFGMEGDQSMHGVYQQGLEVVVALTGTSPNSGTHAQAIVGAWNYLVDLAAKQQETITRETPPTQTEIDAAPKVGGCHGV